VRTCSTVERGTRALFVRSEKKPRERRNDDAQRYHDCVVRVVVVRHNR